jgi:hypothetical protein
VSREAIRYLNNAREILRRTKIERDIYSDVKPVREAMGTACLAILEAVNEALMQRGVSKKELPKSVEAYRELLKRHFAPRNGKLLREFDSLYDMLHIAGYYRGLLHHATVVKDAFKAARAFIEKIG